MIYFDNCATTQIDLSVLEEMNKAHFENFFNPSSVHDKSIDVRIAVNNARAQVALAIGAEPSEIVFTSGGTESNNLAIFGVPKSSAGKIVSSNTEHPSVYNCICDLKNKGFDVVFAPLNQDGSVNVAEFSALVNEKTQFVALMHVNNETGAINDIKKLSALAKAKNPKCIVFCDGIQAFGKLDFNVKDLGVNLYSMSGHKIHGPKGIGALYVSKGTSLNPIVLGGGQERKLRSGTENVAGIVGMGKAIELAEKSKAQNIANFLKFKDFLVDKISEKISDFKIISQRSASSPWMLVLAFENIKSEVLMRILEQKQIYVGMGSACNSKSIYSRVASSIALPKTYSEGIVRICFSRQNTLENCSQLATELCEVVTDLRNLVRGKK